MTPHDSDTILQVIEELESRQVSIDASTQIINRYIRVFIRAGLVKGTALLDGEPFFTAVQLVMRDGTNHPLVPAVAVCASTGSFTLGGSSFGWHLLAFLKGGDVVCIHPVVLEDRADIELELNFESEFVTVNFQAPPNITVQPWDFRCKLLATDPDGQEVEVDGRHRETRVSRNTYRFYSIGGSRCRLHIDARNFEAQTHTLDPGKEYAIPVTTLASKGD